MKRIITIFAFLLIGFSVKAQWSELGGINSFPANIYINSICID